MKRRKTIIAAIILSVCAIFALAFAGCKDSGDNGSGNQSVFSLNKESLIFTELGASETLVPSTTDSVQWATSNPGIATVDGGVVTSVSNGVAEISAIYKEEIAYCVVVVDHQEVLTSGLALSFDKIELQIVPQYGNEQKIVATVTDGGRTIEAQIEWTTSDQTVATVENGIVTAVNKGVAVIKGRVQQGEDFAEAYCVVNVTDDIDISGTDQTEFYTTDIIDLQVKINVNGVFDAAAAVTYFSSDVSVASVNADGVVTPSGAGTVDITAKCGTVEKVFTLNITEKHFITNAAEFLAMDGKGANIVYELKNDIDLNGITYAVNGTNTAAVIAFNGILDGNGYKIKYTYLPEETDTNKFRGLFHEISASATVKNLGIKANVTLNGDYQYGVCGSMKGSIDNCYIEVTERLRKSSSGNWLVTTPIFASVSGSVSNTVIKTAGYAGNNAVTRLPLGTAVTGAFNNVAFVSPSANPDIGWATGVYNSRIKDASLIGGFYAYTDLLSIGTANGVTVRNTDNDNVFEYPEIQTAQSLGQPWAFADNDITLCGRSIFINSTVNISTSEQLLSIPEGDGTTLYVLTNDITISGNAVAIPNTDFYAYIAKFNDVLDGNGHKITYEISVDENYDSAGLIYEIGANAVIKNLRLDGSVYAKADYSYSLCYTNYGTIESCYVYAKADHSGTSASGNYHGTLAHMKAHNGIIKDSIFEGNCSYNGEDKGTLRLTITISGNFENAAHITATDATPGYKNSLYSGYVSTDILSGLRQYTSLSALANGEYGRTVANDNNKYVFADATEAMPLSDAWTFDNGTIKLKGAAIN